MQPYLFGVRNNVHIIDLQQTVPLLGQALEAVREVTSQGGRVLFVGTKRQAQAKAMSAWDRLSPNQKSSTACASGWGEGRSSVMADTGRGFTT